MRVRSCLQGALTARGILCIATLVLLAAYNASQITGSEIRQDARETLAMAVNLAHHGVLSGEYATVEPTAYREPFPAVVSAGLILAMDAVAGRLEVPDDDSAYLYGTGWRARALKSQNVVWAAITAVSLGWLAYSLTGSFWAGYAAGALVSVNIPGILVQYVDTLYTEPVAIALLSVATLLLVLAAQRRSLRLMAAAGVVLGLLALTKAVFLYVVLGLVLCLPIVYRGCRQAGVLAACFMLVVAPWLVRNYTQLGISQISERSGFVLYLRAVKNQLTPEEYKGIWYAWAPNGPARAVAGLLTGFTPDDVLTGGRLVRLNRNLEDPADTDAERAGRPDLALTYYRQSRAYLRQLEREYADSDNPLRAADDRLRAEAIAMIRESPGKHIAFILPALWRGAIFSFPVLMVALGYAIWRRRPDLAVTALPALGLVGACALGTAFEYRFGMPATPIAVALVVVIGYHWLSAASRTAGT